MSVYGKINSNIVSEKQKKIKMITMVNPKYTWKIIYQNSVKKIK